MSYSVALVSKQLIQSITSLTVLTLFTITCPISGKAQPIAIKSSHINNHSTSSAYSQAAYTLGAGDHVRVDIFKLPQYSGEYDVLVDGSLNLPQIGNTSVQGLTLAEAAADIATKYTKARILRQPQVTVILVTPRPLKIGVAGEINRPGSYTIPIQGSQFPTITQALQLAGGITQAANLRHVELRRLQRQNSQQTITVDLWQLLRTGDRRNDITLRDGDTIFVPTAPQINLSEAPQLASASFTGDKPQAVNIAVVGEVRQPGTHTLRGEQASPGGLPTVTQALESAGGINPLADVRKIQIRRLAKTGAVQTITIDLWQLLHSGDFQQDLILQNGDTVFVPTLDNVNLAETSQLRAASFAPNKALPLNITVVGEVFRPGPYTVTGSARTGEAGVPGGTGGTDSVPTVTRAIQIAGGIKPLANIRQIQIRRLTSGGSERILKVDLWKLLQGGDSTQDAVLQEGDTILVPTATSPTPAESAQVASASFSPDTIKVNIVGEITKPGLVQIPPNTPLNQALFAAGGFTNRARTSSVDLIRLNPNGTVSRRKIHINLAEGASDPNNPVLYNNDVVVVGRSTLAGISDTLDTALGPVGKFLGIFTLFQLFK